MAVRPSIKLTRKQIYDEVWTSAVSGMALKYSIPYSSIMKQIKDANIPVPPSGYWTKKEFNKETIMTPLPGNPDEVIALYKSSATASRMQIIKKKEAALAKNAKTIQKTESGKGSEKEPEGKPQLTPNIEDEAKKEKNAEQKTEESTTQPDPIAVLGEAEVEEIWTGRTRNVYRREVLYREVWQFPVV